MHGLLLRTSAFRTLSRSTPRGDRTRSRLSPHPTLLACTSSSFRSGTSSRWPRWIRQICPSCMRCSRSPRSFAVASRWNMADAGYRVIAAITSPRRTCIFTFTMGRGLALARRWIQIRTLPISRMSALGGKRTLTRSERTPRLRSATCRSGSTNLALPDLSLRVDRIFLDHKRSTQLEKGLKLTRKQM